MELEHCFVEIAMTSAPLSRCSAMPQVLPNYRSIETQQALEFKSIVGGSPLTFSTIAATSTTHFADCEIGSLSINRLTNQDTTLLTKWGN